MQDGMQTQTAFLLWKMSFPLRHMLKLPYRVLCGDMEKSPIMVRIVIVPLFR